MFACDCLVFIMFVYACLCSRIVAYALNVVVCVCGRLYVFAYVRPFAFGCERLRVCVAYARVCVCMFVRVC